MDNFRARLKNNDLLLGVVVSVASLEVSETLAECGFDWLFLDLEHSTLGIAAAQGILQAVAGRAACLARLPANDPVWIKQALDIGAQGVILPQVNSAEEARRAVQAAKYPPLGVRSAGLGRAHAYGARLQEALERANDETIVIVQVEHIQAVENIAAILQVEGVDGVFVGPLDLSASLGLIGQVEHPQVQAAIGQALQACRATGVPAGIFAGKAAAARRYIQQGFRLIAAGTDLTLLAGAAQALQSEIRREKGADRSR